MSTLVMCVCALRLSEGQFSICFRDGGILLCILWLSINFLQYQQALHDAPLEKCNENSM